MFLTMQLESTKEQDAPCTPRDMEFIKRSRRQIAAARDRLLLREIFRSRLLLIRVLGG